jgi:hypothetical protein
MRNVLSSARTGPAAASIAASVMATFDIGLRMARFSHEGGPTTSREGSNSGVSYGFTDAGASLRPSGRDEVAVPLPV